MNCKLHFSTYQTTDSEEVNYHRQQHLEDLLQLCFAYCNLQGATIESMRGYWEGEVEPSYAITLYDVSKQVAESLQKQLKQVFNQDEVLLIEL